MPTSERGADPQPPLGVLQSLKAYFATWVDLLAVRVELLSTELEEEKQRLQQMLILGLAAAVCLAFGAFLATLFVVALFWETDYRLTVLGVLTLLYLAAGGVVAVIMARKSKSRPKLLSATLGELAKDYTHLTS